MGWLSDMFSNAGSSPLTRGKQPVFLEALHQARLIPAHAGKTNKGGCYSFAYAAHPRSRGENDRPSIQRAMREGSSPLTRGKLIDWFKTYLLPGLIPAHAGKTPSRPRCCRGSGAHPRSRGENPSLSAMLSAVFGSSPLTRGKQRLAALVIGAVRLIPAHAGKTQCRTRNR